MKHETTLLLCLLLLPAIALGQDSKEQSASVQETPPGAEFLAVTTRR
jgi:hypothetical protein